MQVGLFLSWFVKVDLESCSDLAWHLCYTSLEDWLDDDNKRNLSIDLLGLSFYSNHSVLFTCLPSCGAAIHINPSRTTRMRKLFAQDEDIRKLCLSVALM